MENPEEKHPHIPARQLIDRVVLGGSDGAIESVALTAALNGAGVAFGTLVIAGLAFAVAGALSMYFSNYLSRRAEIESLRIDMEREKMEIETEPEEEKAELEGLLLNEGYNRQEVDIIMSRLVKNKEMWLREQLRRELRLHPEDLDQDFVSRPASAGIAFFLLAILALLPYATISVRTEALALSVTLSLVALFALSSRVFSPRHFSGKAGAESAAVGAVAAGLLYVVGIVISSL